MKSSPAPSLGKQLLELSVTLLVFLLLAVAVAMVKVGLDPSWFAFLMPLPFVGTWLVHRSVRDRFFR